MVQFTVIVQEVAQRGDKKISLDRTLKRTARYEKIPGLGENIKIAGDYYEVTWVGHDPFKVEADPEVVVHSFTDDFNHLVNEEGWVLG